MQDRKFPRPRQAKWDRRHLVTVGTHLTQEQYDLLRAACEANHTTPYYIVRGYLLEYINATRRRLRWDAAPPKMELPGNFPEEYRPAYDRYPEQTAAVIRF